MFWIGMIAGILGSSLGGVQHFSLSPAQIEPKEIKLGFYEEEVEKAHFFPLMGSQVQCKKNDDEAEICSGVKGYLYHFQIPAWKLSFEEELKSDFFSSELEKVYEIGSFVYDPERVSNWTKIGNILFANHPREEENFHWWSFWLNPWYRGGEKLVYLRNPQHLSETALFEKYGLNIQKGKGIACQDARFFGSHLACYHGAIEIKSGLVNNEKNLTPILIIKDQANQAYFLLIEQEMVSSQFGRIEIFT